MNKLNILHIPDPHLFDDKVGCAPDYADESVRNLENIKNIFFTGDYQMITFGGDIQHKDMDRMKYISNFMKIFREIGEIARQRLEEIGALEKMTVYSQDGELVDLSEYTSLVFTVKGQHDSNADGYTFFDMLIDNKVLINPRTIMLEGLQYNFINYNKRADSFIEPRRPETKVMINSFHFPILERGILADGFAARALSPSDHGIFKDVDLAIINDIHKSIDPYSIETGGTQTLVMTPGSVGRTSLDEGQDRDTANLLQIEIDFTDDYGLNAELVEMELKPADEFFNKGFVVQKKIRENAFENFRVELSTVEIDYFNPIDDIQALEDVPDDVKEVAIDLYNGKFDKLISGQ